MALSFKHLFTSAKSDGVDSTLIQPSNWNDEHVLTMAAGKVLGRTGGSGAGAVEELPLAIDSNGSATLENTDAGSNLGPLLKLTRTSASPAFNDLIGAIQFRGMNNAAAEVIYAMIYTYLVTVTNGDEEGGIAIQTQKASVLADSIIISQRRVLAVGGLQSLSPTSGVGYAIGAGGTVTQATSKTTGVTLNKVCGGITMHAAALANNAIVTFVVTCSAVDSVDIPTIAVRSPQSGKYEAWISGVSTGSFEVSVKNVSGGSLSEAVILNVGLLKSSLT
jgi:hypothetical protein